MINPTMKKALPMAISMATALTLTACSSSDDSTPDNTGSGYVSTGTITGFGSVYVNGVKFETDSATFDVDGVSGTQDDLAVGMKVGVAGTINDDGISGTATSIDFDEELQGPVSDITVGDGQTRSFTVLGSTVIIDSNDTNFDDDSGAFSFDTIENGDNVEISGLFDETGTLHATRIELEDADFDASSIVEIEGIITGLSGTSFTIGALNVGASAAELDDLPNGLVDGLKVEVKGTYDVALNTLTATKVEGKDDSLSDSDDEIEIEGIITRYVSDSDFDVGSHPVDASSAEKEPASLTLSLGLHVEVEGSVSGGVLIASEVKTREDENEVGALVSSVDSSINPSTFTLEPVAGQTITVRVTTVTELEDEDLDVDPFSITDIQVGDYIKAEGHINSANELAAESVHRKDATDEDIVVEGVITTFDTVSTTVTVMGINFPYDIDTKFEIDDSSSNSTDFFNEASVIDGTAVISVVDSDTDGVADEIELED